MRAFAPIVLPPLGALYGTITRARTALYEAGLLPVYQLDKPVISVGNITTGGTGKTPLVEWLARVLFRQGRRVCILTRGYGRADSRQRVVVSNVDNVLATADQAGDEALLLAEQLRGMAVVISDSDRVAAGEWAIRRFEIDTFILDDGFQHLRLRRDLNIVTIDATNPWGGGHLLPYGRLREPLSSLHRADCIVLTRLEQVGDRTDLVYRLGSLSRNRPVFCSQMHARGFSLLEKGMITPVRNTLENPVLAFCGVGNPEAFFNGIRRQGYELAETRVFPDHHKYKRRELDSLMEDAKRLGVRNLVTTAKDAVKLTSFDFEIPCHVLDIEVVIEDAERLIELIRASVLAKL